LRLGAVIVALLFAFFSYMIISGLAARIARRWSAATPYQTS
jgi:hypothetical protein